MDQPIQAFDWARMFMGDEPPLFLLEVAFRTIVIYIYTLILLRWLGSRTIGQLSTIEFLLVIALGSAVGDAMFYPDVPLLHALLVITMVVFANKGLDIIIDKNQAAERAIDGIPAEAIRNGVVNRKFMDGNTLSESELFQQLREHGVTQLGQVAHAYLETDGALTIFKAKVSHPGLPIVPPWEIEPPAEVTPADSSGTLACKKCGTISKSSSKDCSHCGHDVWVRAQF